MAKRKVLLWLLTGLLPILGFGQDTTYFDSNWRITSKGEDAFFRTVKQNGDHWEFQTFYSDNGQIQRRAFFKSREAAEGRLDPPDPVGIWTYWYPNGEKETESEIKDGKSYMLSSWTSEGTPMIVDGAGTHLLDKDYLEYYLEYEIKDGVKNGFYREYDKSKKPPQLRLEKHYQDGILHGPYQRYYLNGQLRASGQYENGLRKGKWQWWTPSGKKLDRHVYKGGSGEKYEEKDIRVDPIPINMDEVIEGIGLAWKEEERHRRGQVKISVLISKYGSPVQVLVVKDPDPHLTEIVLEQIQKVRYKPGTIANEPVPIWLIIPFDFTNSPKD